MLLLKIQTLKNLTNSSVNKQYFRENIEYCNDIFLNYIEAERYLVFAELVAVTKESFFKIANKASLAPIQTKFSADCRSLTSKVEVCGQLDWPKSH